MDKNYALKSSQVKKTVNHNINKKNNQNKPINKLAHDPNSLRAAICNGV